MRRGTKAERTFFKRYRTTAKPVGLGFPGQLGPEKMAFKIFPQYDLEATVADCAAFRELWLGVYPEMHLFRRWLKAEAEDPNHPGRYRYTAGFGFQRVGATFAAAANGMLMQTDGALAAKIALFQLEQAARDPELRSFLYGRFDLNLFVHDEVMGATPDDPVQAPVVCEEVRDVMRKSLKLVCPDVDGDAESCLTRRWSKAAEPTYDSSGAMIPWEPEIEE